MSIKINTNQNIVTVTQPVSNVIYVAAVGPQGPQGPAGTGGGGSETDPIFVAWSGSINTFTSSIQTQVNNLTAATSSYMLTSATQSMLQPYVLTSTTSSMLQPYVLTSVTGSMLQPYVLTSITSSMIVSGALTASFLPVNTYQITASWAQSASQALTASYVNPLTQNVIITGSIYLPDNAHSVYFSGSASASRLVWNDIDGTLDLGLKGGNVTLQIGQEQVVRVVNKTGANLLESQYKAVRIRRSDEGGTQGQRLAVVLAQGNNDANSVDTLGIVTENIEDNQEGFITISGLVRNINTTSTGPYGENWVDGDALYLSPTIAGALTNIKPQAPDHTVTMGYVVYAHQNNGKIFVKVDNGYEIDELHNIRITTSSLTTGQLLSYSSSVWINTNQLTGSYGITGSLSVTGVGITGVGVTNQIIYNNGTVLTGDNRLTFDGSNFVVRSNDDTVDAFSTAQSVSYTYTEIPQQRYLSLTVQDNLINGPIQTGEVIRAGTVSGIADWDLAYLDDADDTWKAVDQTSTKSANLLGIYDSNIPGIYLEGYLVVGDYANASNVPLISGSLAAGKPVYIAQGVTSAPFLSTTVPTSGIVRIVGHLIRSSGDTFYWLMKFRPDHTWVEI